MIPGEQVFHPAERYIRVRVWQGASEVDLLAEVREVLHLPGFRGDEGLERFKNIFRGCRAKRPMKLIKGRPAKKGKNSPPPWMDTPRAEDLDPEEYQVRFNLEYYSANPEGVLWFRDAARLWLHPPTREFLSFCLVSEDPHEVVADRLKARTKRLTRKPLCARHITVFEELFWNFRGLARVDLVRELGRFAVSGKEGLAAVMGRELAEFSIFGAPLRIDDVTMYRTAAHVGYAQIAQMRVLSSFDSKAFTAAFSVMREALHELKELESEDGALSDADKDAIRVREEDDFASYDEIMANAELANEARIIEDSWARGIIQTETRDVLIDRNRKQGRMGGDLREELILLIRNQESEAEEDDAVDARARGERTMSYDEIAAAASETGVFQIDEDEDWDADPLQNIPGGR